ncbi:hypothetical protein P7C70_g22, partial [Phenoliferia sp. Uapishka_3]
MSSPAFRTSQKIASLTARLNAVKSAPASLPSEFSALRIRHKGIKGNAGIGAWIRDSLPAIAYASPHVQISSMPPHITPEPDADASTTVAAPSTAPLPFQLPPGVFIQFNDPALPEAFLPFTTARSDVLSKRFWEVVQDPVALEKLRSSPEAMQAAEEIPVQAEAGIEEGIEAPLAEGAPVKVKKEGRSVEDLLL